MRNRLAILCLGLGFLHLFNASSPAAYAVDFSRRLPSPEISGLGRYGKGKLLAVGDKDFKVIVLQEKSPAKITAIWDFTNLLSPYLREEDSQWEAIASDASGRLFILEEEPGRLFVIDPKKDRVDAVIDLVIPENHPLHDAWDDEPNSRGEGLVLLKNGHFLVAKEKKPSAIIEFGPRKDEPSGYRSGDAVGRADKFPWDHASDKLRYYPLKTWYLSEQAQEDAEDLSELAVNEDGDLFALSDKSSTLIELSSLAISKKNVTVNKVRRLPSAVEKVEGLVLDDADHPKIACDLKDTSEPSLFHLKPRP